MYSFQKTLVKGVKNFILGVIAWAITLIATNLAGFDPGPDTPGWLLAAWMGAIVPVQAALVSFANYLKKRGS